MSSMQYDLLESQSHHSFSSASSVLSASGSPRLISSTGTNDDTIRIRDDSNPHPHQHQRISAMQQQSSGEAATESLQASHISTPSSPPTTSYIIDHTNSSSRYPQQQQQQQQRVPTAMNKDVDIGCIRHSLIAPCCCFLLNKPARSEHSIRPSSSVEDYYGGAFIDDPLNRGGMNSSNYHSNTTTDNLDSDGDFGGYDYGYGQVLINQNVLIMLLSAGTYGIADSIWSGTVLCVYILMLMGDNDNDMDASSGGTTSNNKFVGYMEAVNGLAYMISGPILTRVLGRCLRNGAILNWFGLPIFMGVGALTIVVLDWVGTDEEELSTVDNSTADQAYVYFIVLMGLWGFRQRLMNGPAQQLFVDSCTADNHDKFRVALFAVYIIASSAGALLSIIVFRMLGDDWTLGDLRNVMYVGISLELFVGVLLFFFNDKKAIHERQTPYEEKHFPGPPSSAFAESTVYQSVTDDGVEAGPNNLPRSNPQEMDESDSVADDLFDGEESSSTFYSRQANMTPLEYTLTKRIFAYCLFAQSFVINVGSGLTIKFFPLFFRFDTGASPSEIQSIYSVLPILMVFCSGLSRRFSETNGQIKTILQVKCTGLACLYAMALGGDTIADQRWLTLLLFLAYKAFMSSTHPIEEQLTFQYVDKDEFKWFTNLDTLSRIGWAVSAAVGGILIDFHDYQYVFLIAAVIQTFGIFFIAVLMPLAANQTINLPDDDSERSEDEFSSDFSESVSPSHQAFNSSLTSEGSGDLKVPLISTEKEMVQGVES